MEVLFLDESKTDNYFVYGGYLIESDRIGHARVELLKKFEKSIEKKLPANFELKSSPKENEDGIKRHSNFLYESQNTEILPYTFLVDEVSNNTTYYPYLNEKDIQKMRDVTLSFVIGDSALKLICFIFPAVKKGTSESKVLEKHMKALKCCTDAFEKYLNESSKTGAVIVNKLGGEAGKTNIVDQKLLDFFDSLKYKRISLFLPQIISSSIFTIPNVFLNYVGRVFEDKSRRDTIAKSLRGNVLKMDVYPKNTVTLKKLNLFISNL